MPAVVGPSWAARQAREDRISGNVCLSYEDFLRTYGLRESDASRRVWKAYHERAKVGTSQHAAKVRAEVELGSWPDS